MYRQGNGEDFCGFKVLKFLVWFVKSSSLQIDHFIINRKSSVYTVHYSIIIYNKTTVISFRKGLN